MTPTFRRALALHDRAASALVAASLCMLSCCSASSSVDSSVDIDPLVTIPNSFARPAGLPDSCYAYTYYEAVTSLCTDGPTYFMCTVDAGTGVYDSFLCFNPGFYWSGETTFADIVYDGGWDDADGSDATVNDAHVDAPR